MRGSSTLMASEVGVLWYEESSWLEISSDVVDGQGVLSALPYPELSMSTAEPPYPAIGSSCLPHLPSPLELFAHARIGKLPKSLLVWLPTLGFASLSKPLP